MAIDPLVETDLNRDEMAGRVNDLQPQGFRLLSLSMYGDPKDARYAAVWDKRAGPEWKIELGSGADLASKAGEHKKDNFFPRLVTATGGDGQTLKMSAVFEKLDPPKTRELTVHGVIEAFPKVIRDRALAGWILMSATVYDDPKNQTLFAAVWARNSGKVAWTAFIDTTAADVKTHFDAERSGWARLAFVTKSTQGRVLSLYRDDHVGPIGQDFAAVTTVSLETLNEKKAAWLKDGFHITCLQGSGSGNNRSFAAIASPTDKLVDRVKQTRGGPDVPDIDNAVFDLMKKSNIRGAALAIVQGTKLVLARGYTWAEPDYPVVEPKTVFRLGSCSKLITALAIHQLVAEGKLKLTDVISEVLPLTPPNNEPAANTKYLTGQIQELLQKSNDNSPRYEPKNKEIAGKFENNLPVTHEQIASFWITKPLVKETDGKRLDDFGYFLAGQIAKQERLTDLNQSLMKAVASRITTPLQITRIRSARSRLLVQLPDEARYHSRDLVLNPSVMTKGQPLVPREYGDENLETMEASGGLSAAVTDLARILAAMNAHPYSPLGRPAIDKMLFRAIVKKGGHGFDSFEVIDPTTAAIDFAKGGMLSTTQAGLVYSKAGFSYVVVWNGLHAGDGLDEDQTLKVQWYPRFQAVLDAAAIASSAGKFSGPDLFPQFDMDSFAPTQDGFRWCKKCQALFLGGNSGGCPAGLMHDESESKNYTLMHSAKLPYGQDNWRLCKKCQGLYFGGPGPRKCPSAPKHVQAFNTNYSLIMNSPYKEHQTSWRWCKKCQGLFFKGKNPSVCPATGEHDGSESGDYSLAFS